MPVLKHVMQCRGVAGYAGLLCLHVSLIRHPAVQDHLAGQHLRMAAGGRHMSSPRAAPATPPPGAACRPSSALFHPLPGAPAYASMRLGHRAAWL